MKTLTLKTVALFTLFANGSFALEAKKEEKPIPIPMEQMGRSVIVIDPKARAADFVHAFNALRKDKPSFKIMVQTTAAHLEGVTDVSVLNGGTLLTVQYMTTQGNRMQIVPVEQMMEIQYAP